MKKKNKWLIGLASVLLISFVISIVLTKNGKIERIAFAKTTNIDQSLESSHSILEELASFPELHHALSKESPEAAWDGAYVIPGLDETVTLNHHSGELDVCTTMTPQGLAVNEDYVFISAYCYTAEHHSVIYVLNKGSRELVKEIVLNGIPHVGGMAYDDTNDVLWVTSEKDETAQVVTLSLDSIEAYDLESDGQPISYSDSIDLPEIKRASTVTIHDGSLYVAYFNEKNTSVMHQYVISRTTNAEGKIVHALDTTQSIEEASPDDVNKIGKEIQGLVFYEEKLLLSRSSGRDQDSTLLFFNRLTEDNDFTDKNANIEIAMPSYMEQIVIHGNQLYILFESGAYPYREHGNPSIDRVLTVDITELFTD